MSTSNLWTLSFIHLSSIKPLSTENGPVVKRKILAIFFAMLDSDIQDISHLFLFQSDSLVS